jgi:hypothetical protein
MTVHTATVVDEPLRCPMQPDGVGAVRGDCRLAVGQDDQVQANVPELEAPGQHQENKRHALRSGVTTVRAWLSAHAA